MYSHHELMHTSISIEVKQVMFLIRYDKYSPDPVDRYAVLFSPLSNYQFNVSICILLYIIQLCNANELFEIFLVTFFNT